MRAAALLVLAGLAHGMTIPGRPKYIDCVTSEECGPWECCVLGGARFSLPKCVAMSDIGDPCRPASRPDSFGDRGSRAVNMTVTYPDGQMVNFSSVYLHTCPCIADLKCDPLEATCVSPMDPGLDNTL